MKIAELETELGTLVVEQSGYTEEGYPGFTISLLNYEFKEIAAALLEVDETETTPEVKVHVWDSTHDEPVCDMRGCVDDDKLELEFT